MNSLSTSPPSHCLYFIQKTNWLYFSAANLFFNSPKYGNILLKSDTVWMYQCISAAWYPPCSVLLFGILIQDSVWLLHAEIYNEWTCSNSICVAIPFPLHAFVVGTCWIGQIFIIKCLHYPVVFTVICFGEFWLHRQ